MLSHELVSKMITNDNKGTYLVKNDLKHDNVIYERPLTLNDNKVEMEQG